MGIFILVVMAEKKELLLPPRPQSETLPRNVEMETERPGLPIGSGLGAEEGIAVGDD